MTTQEIIEKLRELGIESENCYPKKSFIPDDETEPFIGMYKREFAEDFYFFIEFTKTMYVLRKVSDISQFKEDSFHGDKYLVPLSKCEVIYKDKPLEELPDKHFSEMTLREYACIQLKVPNSGTPWLDNLIKDSYHTDSSQDGEIKLMRYG